MTPAEKGRFCNSCQRKVFEFTDLADAEIISSLKPDTNVCIRAHKNQLGRPLQATGLKSPWIAATLALAGLLALGTNQATAQAITERHQVEHSKPLIQKNKDLLLIKGVITNGEQALSGVNIRRYNKRFRYRKKNDIITNDSGTFSFKVNVGDKLFFWCKGYEPHIIEIIESIDNLNIVLEEETDMIILGKVHIQREISIPSRLRNLLKE